MGGYSVAHAMMMMIPEAWENHSLMTQRGARSTNTTRR